MDEFDRYLFDELTDTYTKEKLATDDYEELYQRFCNMDHLEEVKPYLFAMRFLGLGVSAERDTVQQELKSMLPLNNSSLAGLYYDLLLFEDESNSSAVADLTRMVEKGYTDKYLKDRSHIHTIGKNQVSTPPQKEEPAKSSVPEAIKFKRISFESCGYNGRFFTAGDIDYLSARVYIEPLKSTRKLKVRSQIFDGDNTFSDIMNNEYTLQPGTSNFKTTGWGNKNFYGYHAGVYKWVIELDGEKTYTQEFRIYGGKLNKNGVPVKDIKLFASKAKGALEADRENYKTTFDATSLEYVYFKLFIDEPGEDMPVQIFIKITCLEDNSTFWDRYVIHPLNSNTIACWHGVGFSQPGKWKKGLYQYSINIGNGPKHKGTFTVY